MKKIWSVFIGLLLVAGTLAIPAIVLAGQQGTCPVSDPEKVLFYENAIGDTSDGNDTLYQCGTGYANLGNLQHTLPGLCKSHNIRLDDDWGDCLSSIRPFIPAGRSWCGYNLPNYTGSPIVRINSGGSGVRVSLGALDDGLDSWKFIDSGFAC